MKKVKKVAKEPAVKKAEKEACGHQSLVQDKGETKCIHCGKLV